MVTTKHRTIEIDGVNIFYREAGSPSLPTLLLLHGFPTSSHMFRNLIPALADRFHLIAPNYPGYGNSTMPSVDDFDYSFDNLAALMDRFTGRCLHRAGALATLLHMDATREEGRVPRQLCPLVGSQGVLHVGWQAPPHRARVGEGGTRAPDATCRLLTRGPRGL